MVRCDFCGKNVKDSEIVRSHYGSGFGYTRLSCPSCTETLGIKDIIVKKEVNNHETKKSKK